MSNYPLTHSQFFNLNMKILWVRVLKEWSQWDGSFVRSKQTLNVGTILCWIFSYQDLCREKTQIKLRIYNTDTGKHEKTPH